MTADVYWLSGSPFAWCVFLLLELKKAPYNSVLLSESGGDLKTPEFEALTPRRRTPVIRDGDMVLWESVAILAYLDQKFPEPPLFGRKPEETGQIWRVILECVCYLEPHSEGIVNAVFEEHIKLSEAQYREMAAKVHGEFQNFENQLSDHDWLAVENISAADLVVYPFTEIFLRACAREPAASLDLGFLPLDKNYPAIAAWHDRIRAIEGYDKTYPPHWREAA